MSGFVVLLAMAAIGLAVAMLLCKSPEQRISTGVSFAVLVLFCVCCRLFLAPGSAGLPPLVVACALLPPAAYAVVFALAGRRAQRSTGLGELRAAAPANRSRPSVSDKKKVHPAHRASPEPVSATAPQSPAFATISPAPSGQEAVQGAQWGSWNTMDGLAAAPPPVPSEPSLPSAAEADDSKADLESTAELPRVAESASGPEPAPEAVAPVEPVPTSGLFAASITEPIAVPAPEPEQQPVPEPVVEPISASDPESARGADGEAEPGSTLETDAGPAPEPGFASAPAPSPVSDADAFGEVAADEAEARGGGRVEPPAPPSVVLPLRLADDEEVESGSGLAAESGPGSESGSAPGADPEPVPAPGPAFEPGPEPGPEPVSEHELAPEPEESPFDAERFFSKAASLRDRGLFLVAAPVYAECASRSEDPAVARRASFEELACYVKGGRIDAARGLALELRGSLEDLTPVEAMKLDAVLGMEA